MHVARQETTLCEESMADLKDLINCDEEEAQRVPCRTYSLALFDMGVALALQRVGWDRPGTATGYLFT